jgi:nucleoside-diphosphate-sugar epimerase
MVTGASGFIGRWSVPALLALGYEVHAVLSDSHDAIVPDELKGAQLHRGNLLREASIDAAIDRVRPTHLLHFAWIAQPGVYWQSPDNFLWLEASEYLLRRFHAAGGQRVVMAGSCAEYDWSGTGVFDEMTGPLADASAPTTPAYTVCKLRLQLHLARFCTQHRLSSAWGRIFFQYGPHEHPERLVPSVIRSLLRDREALCSHGRQVRGFLHVADVGAAFASILSSELQGAVNVGSDRRIALAELIERIAQKIGRPDLVRLGARAASAEPPLLIPETRRLRQETAWRPRFDLDGGLADTIRWWQAHLAAAVPAGTTPAGTTSAGTAPANTAS